MCLSRRFWFWTAKRFLDAERVSTDKTGKEDGQVILIRTGDSQQVTGMSAGESEGDQMETGGGEADAFSVSLT